MNQRAVWHYRIYGLSLLGVVIGLPLNKVVLSLSGMLMVVNWLVEGGFKAKWQQMKQQKTGLLLAILFLYLALTLLYSRDLDYGLKDLRIKLPMLFCPIVILSSPALTQRLYRSIIMAFIASITLVTIVNYSYFNLHAINYSSDVRLMSLFDSHIRLSLMVAAAAFITMKTFFNIEGWKKFPMLVLTFWLLFYTHKSEVLTGYFSFIIVGITLAIWFVFQRFKRHRVVFGIASCTAISAIVYLLYLEVYPIPKEVIDRNNLPEFTELGGRYEHNRESVILENGHYIHYYVCQKELDSIWQIRTNQSLLSNENEYLFPTLIRYMTALGLRKDALGLLQLTDEDIKNVQNGFPSPVYAAGGLNARLARITIEIQKHLEGADPNGSTIQQRLEYWKTGLTIIKENVIFGIGIGDVQKAFNEQYEINNSRLFAENRLHTHQQFLTFWIGTGFIGLLIFLTYIFLVLRVALVQKSYTLLVFWSIITFSYFFEDTLETQVGVTLAAFFITFILKQEQENKLFE